VNRTLAGTLVVVCSAAVLVLEVLALRLVAPYAGLTLDTYTAAIGVTLAAIASGAAVGGRAADTFPPAALIGPLVLAGGVLLMLARPVVLAAGPVLRGGGAGTAILLVALAVVLPVAVLSAVPPVVVKLQLAALGDGAVAGGGTVVGRFSALGTLGALAGTFLTGYVLLATLPTSLVLLTVGLLLAVAGAALSLRLPSAGPAAVRRGVARGGAAALVVAALLLVVPDDCDYESAYYCVRVQDDSSRPSGRTLYLDNLRHSYVDLDDPTYLEFSYIQRLADVLAELAPASAAGEPAPGGQVRPLRVLHVGGGGFTLPRWLAAAQPGSHSTVLELDPVVVQANRERLGLRTGPDLRVRVGDARLAIASEPTGAYDVVVGDAFGSLSVPWHLATREFDEQVRRVLRPGGMYLLNVIDNPPLDFLGAEIATLRTVFDEVGALASAAQLREADGGNYVLMAADRLPGARALAALDARGAARPSPYDVATAARVDALARDAPVLTDDDAPVDQLITTIVR